MFRPSALIVLALCALTIQICSGNEGFPEFKVLTPNELKKEFANPNLAVSGTVGNFGDVPWGRRVIGNLYYTDPHDACSQINPINTQGDGSGKFFEGEAPILIADRGGCSFVMKAQNAQLAGARLLIVKDNTEENVATVMPVDDGHGGAINIPMVLINKRTGELFEKYLTEGKQVAISVNFPMPQTYDTIQYEIWLTSSDMRSFSIIKDLAKHHEQLQGKAVLTPHYAVWYCPECEYRNFTDTTNANCFSGGRYCSPDPDGNGPLSGRDTIEEDLRQICIHKKDPAAWWKYHLYFSDSCLNSELLKSCSIDTIKAIGLNPKDIETCVSQSFIGEDRLLADNTILAAEREAFNQRGILTWPTIVINNMTYRGSLEPASLIFKAMCAGFSNRPAECEEPTVIPVDPMQPNPVPKTLPKKNKSHLFLILSIIFIAIILFFVIFIMYKRQMKKEILQEMDYKISSTMHRYIAMGEDSGRIAAT